uniref:Cation channel sperm associated 3 n=1 Tax=Sphenodon punctatus TaxID=8508 RepID=A0A8D0L651_SPHPU
MDTNFCAYICRLLKHPLFKSIMISSISLNAVFMAVETDYTVRYESYSFLEVGNQPQLVSIFPIFLLKLYVDPVNYWGSGYNLFDALVLCLGYLPYYINKNDIKHSQAWIIVKGFQALRIFKLISYSGGMRILMTALRQTVKTVIYILVLLFLLMFIFAILGHGLYGNPETGDTKNWGSLAAAFFTLFSLVTVDGWTDLQDQLDEHGFHTSQAFTIVFILLGFFVFFNMSIGVVIINIQNSTQNYEQNLQAEKQAIIWMKKRAILKRQQEEINMLMQKQKSSEYRTFSDLVEHFKKTLHHSDAMVLEDICASLPFIDLYLTSLNRQDTTIYRLQELYYELADTLNTILKEEKSRSAPMPEETSRLSPRKDSEHSMT